MRLELAVGAVLSISERDASVYMPLYEAVAARNLGDETTAQQWFDLCAMTGNEDWIDEAPSWHGIIALSKVVLDTGMLPAEEPATTLRIDTPAGLVVATSRVIDGVVESTSSRIRTVASVCASLSQRARVAPSRRPATTSSGPGLSSGRKSCHSPSDR